MNLLPTFTMIGGEEMIITSKCNGCDSLLKEIAVGVVLNKEGNDSMDSIVYKTNYEITPTDFLFCDWVCYGKFMDRKFPPVNKIYHKW